jgi:hypothetical protein
VGFVHGIVEPDKTVDVVEDYEIVGHGIAFHYEGTRADVDDEERWYLFGRNTAAGATVPAASSTADAHGIVWSTTTKSNWLKRVQKAWSGESATRRYARAYVRYYARPSDGALPNLDAYFPEAPPSEAQLWMSASTVTAPLSLTLDAASRIADRGRRRLLRAAARRVPAGDDFGRPVPPGGDRGWPGLDLGERLDRWLDKWKTGIGHAGRAPIDGQFEDGMFIVAGTSAGGTNVEGSLFALPVTGDVKRELWLMKPGQPQSSPGVTVTKSTTAPPTDWSQVKNVIAGSATWQSPDAWLTFVTVRYSSTKPLVL